MTEHVHSLFDETPTRMNTQPPPRSGLLPYQTLKALIHAREIIAPGGISGDQVQPATIDLRLGDTAYRVRASFLPGEGHTVEQKIVQYCMHKIDLTADAVLERDCVYIVPLMEYARLSSRISGLANPKSSVGRLDIFTRLITDGAAEFDRVPPGYDGRLYVEIAPRTFSVVVRRGSRLNQLRLRRGSPLSSDTAMKRLHEEEGLVDRRLRRSDILNGVPLTVDLRGFDESGLVGFRAKKHAGLIDIDKIAHYAPLDYWEPIFANNDRSLILNPDDFYILASKEAVSVPPTHAAEMAAYDTLVGEFRVHYAGFFDPGFGHSAQEAKGTRAVLEVRSHDVPFMIEDGQLVGRLIYEQLTDVPDRLYGEAIGSSYQRQGLHLSKQFKPYQ